MHVFTSSSRPHNWGLLEAAVVLTAAFVLVNTVPAPSHLQIRAFPDSPSGSYAPGIVKCPTSESMIRNASSISAGERDWVAERHERTDRAIKDFLNRASMIDFDVATFMDGYSPNIGLAFSGGGYRAMLNGGGVFKAFDSRTPGSTRPAHMGGLVQAATYIAGLSGGSWMLGSVVVNNFTTIQALQDSEDLWDLENSILAPEGSLQILDTVQYYGDLRDEVMSKRDAGYEVSLTDYWARALSRQFIAGDGGPAITFSSISRTETFRNFEMPFPIIVADERHPGEIILSVNATVFEFNPLEMGSFDPTLFAFTPLEYIGSNVTNGKPDDPERCTKGFDNASFLMGTSSSLFNIGLIQLQSSGLTGILRQFAEDILNGLAEADADIADYSPNPFYKVNPNTNPSANERRLTLVDGGLDGQNIPLQPLIQPARALDVIFAVDSSADTSNWPNGTSLVATYARSLSPMHNRTGFPAIPDQNTFVNLKLNTRPTFFGCDAKNLTGDFDSDVPVPPLIVYIPNHPYTYMSNISTFDPDHDRDVRDAIIENGYNVATMGNGTVDNEWAACAGCAIVRRGEERRGRNQTEQCRRCFDKYCWDGTRDERTPDEINYTVLIAQKSAGLSIKTKSSWTLPAIVAAAVSLALI